MNGRMLSVRGADEHCWQQSRGQNLTGKYRAFISNRFQHLYSIIHRQDRSLPVGNLQVTVDNNSFDMGIVVLGSPSPFSFSRNSSFSLPVSIHRGVLQTRGICTTVTEYLIAIDLLHRGRKWCDDNISFKLSNLSNFSKSLEIKKKY